MMDPTVFTKRRFLAWLAGGGATLLGLEDAEAAKKRKHKRRKRVSHAKTHHTVHPVHAPKAQAAAEPTRSLAAPATDAPVAKPALEPAPLIGGGGGGGGGGGWSDRRLKREIVRLGASPSGLPIYSFQYVWGGPRLVGVMAQDLLALRPDAVILDDSGYYKVDYDRIDVEMRKEAA